jgi:GAF domain-containing protein/FixJ family two-component response regulator
MTAEKVLVVDDAQGVIDFLSDYVLRPNGYEVLSAVDGEGGLALALAQKPDLIILDLEMPKMSGMEVLEALKRRGVDVPVIIITFHGSETIAAQSFRMGVKNYITKPFKMEEILEAVEQALRESRLERDRADLVRRLKFANAELERRIREFNILHGIGQAMNSLLRLEDLLRRAVEAAVYVTGAEQAAVHLLDDKGGSPQVKAQHGRRRGDPGLSSLAFNETTILEVANSGRALLIGKPAVDEIDGLEPAEAGETILVVPLKSRGSVIGTLGVSSAAAGQPFSNNDRYLLSVLADYLAIGVENARLYDHVQRRAEELTLLNEVGQTLSATTDLQRALTLVLERVNSMLKVEAGSLLLVDETSEELVFQVALGEKSEEVKPLRLRLGQGIAGRVAETGVPMLIREVDRSSTPESAVDISTDFLARSVLCVPMVARGEMMGVIEVVNKIDGGFTEDDQMLLSSIATYAAVAVDNARLFRKYESSAVEQIGAES